MKKLRSSGVWHALAATRLVYLFVASATNIVPANAWIMWLVPPILAAPLLYDYLRRRNL